MPSAAVIKNLLAAFERAVDIACQDVAQDTAADAVVEQPVVAAVEGPHAAHEARIVDRQQCQAEQNERQDGAPHLDAHQRHDQRQHGCERNRGSGVLQQPHPPWRRQMHCQGVRLDGNAEDAPPGIARFNRAAAVSRQHGELSVCRFPHYFAAPAHFAAGERFRQAEHLEPGHGEMPAMQPHPETAVAVRAMASGGKVYQL